MNALEMFREMKIEKINNYYYIDIIKIKNYIKIHFVIRY